MGKERGSVKIRVIVQGGDCPHWNHKYYQVTWDASRFGSYQTPAGDGRVEEHCHYRCETCGHEIIESEVFNI